PVGGATANGDDGNSQRTKCSVENYHHNQHFPGTAFLLVKPEDLPEPVGQSELTEKIEKFVQIHRNSFVLLHSPFNGKKELETLALIQRRFFGSNLRVLPVRNTAEMVTGMLMIAKATSRPHVDNIRERMALARAHVMEGSPVWEMLRDLL
uniref:Uncharacterized protein n=1 Tax=Gouania willdenowi TaxID=441366 RepID=A0A8C5E627_GOUWI